ncbi:MAG: amidohydrolase family protein, partial [Planctomycetes bacterium]|nr:amidohydrolase family protein [Planctomycetota bacterium]
MITAGRNGRGLSEPLEPGFVDRRPRLVTDERGTTRYQLEGQMIPPGTGRGAWAPEGIMEASLHREGGVDPKLRLVDMDEEGIDTAVLFGTFGLALWIAPEDLSPALCRAYNNWMADYGGTDASRLKATASLPLRSIEDSVVEARRAVTDLGCVALTLPVNIVGRNPDDPEIFPLYQLAEELDVPIAFHAGGGRFAEDRFTDAYATAHTVCFPMDILFGLTTVLCGGVLERFPKLRVAMLEAGCGFLPYYLERLDERLHGISARRDESDRTVEDRRANAGSSMPPHVDSVDAECSFDEVDGQVVGKGSETHKAAIVGDTV